MTGALSDSSVGIEEIARLEDELNDCILDTEIELSHCECFDDEQRSEVYAILKALKDYTEAHRLTVKSLAGINERMGDA